MFRRLLIDSLEVLLLTLGVSFVSLGVHTSKLQYFIIGGICLGVYELNELKHNKL